ncbi:hypothetical protein JW899_00515 [Candidatus Uhrbacteria bacterium]|nr:hypothetical protein [Candidatus Uhrbacteria bacterium]
MLNVLDETRNFMRRAFVANPSYSFGDWRIMYEHGVRVAEFAERIAE